MKRNILVVVVVLLLSLVLTYPLGMISNKLFFHQTEAGFDVGLDETAINLIIGILIFPSLFSSLIFGIWGIGRWKWIIAILLFSPLFVFFNWAGTYLWLPVASFVSGIILVQIIDFLRGKNIDKGVSQSAL